MTAKASMHLRRREAGAAFTIVEMLISVAVLVLIVLLLTQLINSATAITRTEHKHVDTDTEARAVFDRMAVDFAQMLRRTDIDTYVKAPNGYKNPNAHGNGLKLKVGQQGNDQIAFFSQVPGYYPTGAQSSLSLVAYRVRSKNSSPRYLQLERMGKGLLWNGVSNGTTSTSVYPIVFSPGQMDAAVAGGSNPGNPWAGPWYAAINNDNTGSSDESNPNTYEVVGPQVFRLEYYYLLKDGSISDVPKVPASSYDPTKPIATNLRAFKDVEAIAVAIGVADAATRALLYDPSTPADPYHILFNLMSDMADFKDANGKGVGAQKIGDVENEWNAVIQSAAATGHTTDGNAFPPAAAAAIRVYNRYFELKTL
jgi:competence protein ComGC